MDGVMRIGELSRRTGVSPELLRAWEQRYGLLHPTRSSGGFRLYSPEDEERVRRTTALIAEGMSAAEAARQAAAPSEPTGADSQPLVDDLAEELRRALDGFDTAAGHAALDQLFATVSVEFAITDVLIPYLRDLGERWATGTITVAQEHFASNLIRGRLLGLARDWGTGGSSSAVLACPPGEAHDLGLILFGVLIARRGWRVTFLGADTPFDTLEASLRTLHPSLVVLATCDPELFRRHADAIAGIAATTTTVAVAAPVDERTVSGTGAQALINDIPMAAALVSR
jgi:MerR family transcriptional regulator, light-induced transcriptional regulator